MSNERFSRSLARIEEAAARIERAARAIEKPRKNGDTAGVADGDHALRREAESALAELDRLIERLEA